MDEEQKKQILEKRTANRKLSEIIQAGTQYHEPVRMKLIDGQEHDVQVYALSENEFRLLLEDFGLDLKDVGNREKLTENMKLAEKLAQIATGQDDIAELVIGNGCMEIMTKCFQISGLGSQEQKKVESFQQGNLQPESVRAD
jgi:uncharacterized protein with PhoU and TrkA domain